MARSGLIACVAWVLSACGGGPEPTAAPAATAPAPPPAPAPAQPSAQPQGPNPCANPAPLTLELEAGVPVKTPLGLELTYAIEDDARGANYVFLLRSGDRRWETRRNDGNWNSKQTWRGFCWRGGARPERRASKLQIQIAPLCKDGQLSEVASCDDNVFGS